ncbi:hypothetical protein ACFYUV_27825 [Nonomuraea sp. NPDC003560]|uniref:hypothetical protein n=1 Tax=Nonomuraea sp. NPDC003560 TaxID=3364341 RepID=UPI0036827A82
MSRPGGSSSVGTGSVVGSGPALSWSVGSLPGSALGCLVAGRPLASVVLTGKGSCWFRTPVGWAVGEEGSVRAGVVAGGRLAWTVRRGVAVGLVRSGEAVSAGPPERSPGQPFTESVVPEKIPPTTTISIPNTTTLPTIEPNMTSRRRRPLWSTNTAVGGGSTALVGASKTAVGGGSGR